MKNQWHKKRRRTENSIDKPVLFDLESLIGMVPDRQTADVLLQQYLGTFETTYRVLHVPSFLKSYDAFWTSPTESTPEFVIQLLLVMATVYCVVPGGPQGYVGRSSLCREAAARWIEVCEAWLSKQSHKHITMTVYQVHILLWMAKNLNCIKIKREWLGSGQLVRLGVSAGMHREPTLLSKKISVFDKEMRRRLWYTMLELDYRTACERGMPPTIQALEWDCLPPSNIHDEDFDESTQSLPRSLPLSTFTRTSCLCVMEQHVALRLSILSQVNSIRFSMDLETVMQYDDQIRKALDGLPSWDALPAATVASKLSKLVLFESLLLLHRSIPIEVSPRSRNFYTRMARREAAVSTLQIYAELPQVDALLFANCRDDIFRAIMSSCLDITIAAASVLDPLQNTPAAIKLVDNAVGLLEERVKLLGQGFHSYWISSSALSLVHSKQQPSEPLEKFAQQAADRVVSLHENSIGRQQTTADGPPTAHTDKEAAYKSLPYNSLAQQISKSQQLEAFDGFVPVDSFDESMFGLENFDVADIWNLDF